MLLRKLQIKFFRESFNKSVLSSCNSLISALLDDKNNVLRDITQEEPHIKYFFDLSRKKGEVLASNFRKSVMGDITQIVQSENPIIGMRKMLIKKIHSQIFYNRLLDEKFSDRIQELRSYFNKNIFVFDRDDLISNKVASVAWISACAECYVLRLLQNHYFERTERNDWFEKYSENYHIYMTHLFHMTLDKIDKIEPSVSILSLTNMKRAIDSHQKMLVGVVVIEYFELETGTHN